PSLRSQPRGATVRGKPGSIRIPLRRTGRVRGPASHAGLHQIRPNRSDSTQGALMELQLGEATLTTTQPLIGAGALTDSEPVRILLVGDEPKNLPALASVLERPDRRLVCATSGPEALRYLLRDEFAAVLLDVHMPGMDGFEAAQLIRGRERSRDTPIIFLTAA